MDNSSWLIPASIKAQCSGAIRQLQKDNESLTTADGQMEVFVNNDEIKSSAFDTMKQQINDYKIISQAIRCANESDIADFETLQGAVGDEVLRGDNILSQKHSAEQSRDNNENTAQYYWDMTGSTDNVFFSVYYGYMANRHTELARVDQEIYDKWLEKEEAYDQIESATSGLFAAAEGMRSAVEAGISDISGAFVNGAYAPNMNAAWRADVNSQIEKIFNEMVNRDAVTNEIMNEMISRVAITDEDGAIKDYEWGLLERYSYKAMLLIIAAAEGCNPEDMGINEKDKNKKLASEKLKDWKMKEAITVINQKEKYSGDTWNEATVEERKKLLEQYMKEVTDVYGIRVKEEIHFFYQEPEDNMITEGYYSHGENEVSVNEYIIGEYRSKESYNRLFDTIRHELRHGFQYSAVEQPEDFIVSPDTVQSWKENFADYKKPEDNFEDYQEQPVEKDARDFGGVK